MVYVALRVGISRGLCYQKKSCNTAGKRRNKNCTCQGYRLPNALAVAVIVEAEMQKLAKVPSVWDQ